MADFEVKAATVERLKRKIITQENINLKTHALKDPQMVKWIMKKIEEEVKCYSKK